jgi:hypothetical protein
MSYEADHLEERVEDTIAPRVDGRYVQRYAEHVAGGSREVSDDEGYRIFHPHLLGAAMARLSGLLVPGAQL